MSLIDELFERVTQKSEIAVEYDRAATLDDLLLTASERLCLAACRIMLSFRLPKRGIVVLQVLKWISPSSYDRYWTQLNNVFSECAIFVAVKLRDHVNRDGNVSASEHFVRQMTTWAAVQWYSINRMSPDEIARFKTAMTSALIDFEDNPPVDDSEHMYRIINALGRKPHLTEIPEFAKSVTLRNPLQLVEPSAFVPNYERLARDAGPNEM